MHRHAEGAFQMFDVIEHLIHIRKGQVQQVAVGFDKLFVHGIEHKAFQKVEKAFDVIVC